MKAYATLVMKGNKYIAGALTLAMSLKLNKTKYKIICLVTSDVDTVLLKKIFDDVIQVDYIEVKCKPLKQTRQIEIYDWIDISFTKGHILNQTQYEKIMFLDADIIVNENIDHLFDLECPAATFSSPWAKKYKTEKYRKKELARQVTDEFDVEFKAQNTGEKITDNEIISALNNEGFTMMGSLILIEPNKDDFQRYLSNIKKQIPYGYNCYNGYDEQSFAELYLGKKEWTHIHQQYNFIIHKLKWLEDKIPYVLHYFYITKPWTEKNLKFVFNTSKIWWAYFTILIDQLNLTKNDVKQILNLQDDDIEKLIEFDVNLEIKINKVDENYYSWIKKINHPYSKY